VPAPRWLSPLAWYGACALVVLIGVHVYREFGPVGGLQALPHRLHPLRGEALIAAGVAGAVVVTARLVHPRRRRRV
jgi:hypothetical protein